MCPTVLIAARLYRQSLRLAEEYREGETASEGSRTRLRGMVVDSLGLRVNLQP